MVSSDDDLIALAFTSGTTGLPKGVMQSQRMLKAIIYSGMVEYQARPDDVRYTAAPPSTSPGCGLFMGVAASPCRCSRSSSRAPSSTSSFGTG